MKGLAKDPAQRYQTVESMIARLRRRAEGDIPIECAITFVKSVTNTWTRFVDRHPGIVVGGMGLTAVGALSGIGWALVRALGA